MKGSLKIIVIAGARPNFMKVSPILKAFDKYSNVKTLLVHTGQHFSQNMSDVFFKDLNIKEPDINLGIGNLSPNQQISVLIKEVDLLLEREQPHVVLVVGDVTSTLAAGIACNKFKLKSENLFNGEAIDRPVLVHVESGLRSFDRDMPEEVNRILTDQLSDLLFLTEKSAKDNLLKERVPGETYFVGNVMIDSLMSIMDRLKPVSEIIDVSGEYVLVTLHRPSNVDQMADLESLLKDLDSIIDKKIIFPVHPRTRAKLESNSWLAESSKWILTDPLGYRDFISLLKHSSCILTDSGGIQEESTVLKIPCITLRENTERPITVSEGTNEIVGTSFEKLKKAYHNIENKKLNAKTPELWDGQAADRICKIIIKSLT